jgi:hypothetical protein
MSRGELPLQAKEKAKHAQLRSVSQASRLRVMVSGTVARQGWRRNLGATAAFRKTGLRESGERRSRGGCHCGRFRGIYRNRRRR